MVEIRVKGWLNWLMLCGRMMGVNGSLRAYSLLLSWGHSTPLPPHTQENVIYFGHASSLAQTYVLGTCLLVSRFLYMETCKPCPEKEAEVVSTKKGKIVRLRSLTIKFIVQDCARKLLSLNGYMVGVPNVYLQP